MATIGQDVIYTKKLLEEGYPVAIPTETVYGLAANALNAKAVANIFKVKKRPTFDPLIVHVPSVEAVSDFVSAFPETAKKLGASFWPGPLTLVLKKKNIIPDLATSGLDTVGIRCPNHQMARSLLEQLPFPLAAPSANLFGYVSPTTAMHVNGQLGNKIKYILDGGPCAIGVESTIVGFENESPVLYRYGGVSQEKIIELVGPMESKLHPTSNPKSSGQLESHYAPLKKLVIVDRDSITDRAGSDRVGILKFKESDKSEDANTLILSPKGDINEAATNLFSMLRLLDQMDIDIILAELVPDTGIGKAINDRLQRAAVQKGK